MSSDCFSLPTIGRHRGLDIRPDHVDGRRAGLHPHAVASPLPHDLRILQIQLLHAGHHDAVAVLPGGLQRLRHLFVLLPRPTQLREKLQQVAVIGDGQAGALTQRVIEQSPRQLQLCRRQPGAQVDAADSRRLDGLARAHAAQRALQFPDTAERPCLLPHRLINAALNGVLRRKGLHPAWQIEIQLLQRETQTAGSASVP